MGEKKPATADTQALPKEVRAPRPSEVPEGTQMVKQTVREACATRWPRRCGAIPTCS
jgi:hypothetical protein